MSRKLSITLLDAKSAADATGIGTLSNADVHGTTEFGIYVEFDGTAAAGTVSIETASKSSYSGTWAVITSVAWTAANKSHYVAITGCIGALRARITGAVTGGTVTVTAYGNQP